MAILLAIIKTILKLLLIILALIIILILLILFVPFRYRAAGVKEPGTIEAEASVTWLLHMLTVEVGYSLTSGRRLTKDIRIFGISLFKVKNLLNDRRKSKAEKEKEKRRQEKKKKLEKMKTEDPERYEQLRAEALARKQEENRRKEEEERKRQEEEEKKKEAERARLEAEKAEKEALQKKQEEEEKIRREAEEEAQRKAEAEAEARKKAETQSKEEENEAVQETGQPSGSVVEKIFHAVDKIRTRITGKAYGLLTKILKILLKLITTIWFLPWKIVSVLSNVFGKIESVSEKIDSLCSKVSDIREFLEDEHTQEVLSLLKKQIGRLIGHIIPRTLNGYVQFGLDDPYLTGRVLATACVFYPLYGRTFRLEPDFEELVFNGRAELKGRIFLFYLAFIALTTYFNKNTKFVINYIKSFNNKEDSE